MSSEETKTKLPTIEEGRDRMRFLGENRAPLQWRTQRIPFFVVYTTGLLLLLFSLRVAHTEYWTLADLNVSEELTREADVDSSH